MDDRLRAVELVSVVQAMPYAWPAPPDAASCRRNGAGSCASKHVLLAEELRAIGIESAPMFVLGPLVPPALVEDSEIAPGAGLQEVHELLTVQTPWAGPLRVDVTWDPPLIAQGLPGTLDWDGAGDMLIAVGEGASCWVAPREALREAKEALRRRLYRAGEREVRDRVLAAMARRFEEWRRDETT
ncbi:MAG: hypothetical protein IIA90_04840 [Chloroflexi bacterium]|nr:hypothetical protein [Chloroflexota bacterium]